MVVLGHDSTVPATVDEMIVLTRAARRRGARTARRGHAVRVIPGVRFGGADQRRPLREGGRCRCGEAEGGGASLSRVRAIVGAGIPVMGHIGLTPQSATMLGGYKAQGRTAAKARALLADAQALQEAGCFAIVLEAVPAPVATRISQVLRIPTIGIGAGGMRRPGPGVA